MNRYVIFKRIMISLLAFVSAALFILNLALIKRNKELTALTERTFLQVEIPVGTLVPPIRGMNLQGDSIVVDPSGKRHTLLMVFTTSCPFCRKNWPNWESLIKGLDKRNVNIVLIDLSSLADKAYLHAHLADGLTTITQIDPAMRVSYQLGEIPETILIGPDARVKRVWIGVLEPKDANEIVSTCSKNVAKERHSEVGVGR
jgi:hypothetical protein